MKKEKIACKTMILHVDGASRGNPGKAGIGFVILDSEKTNESGRLNILEEGSDYIGEATNNVAEYKALIEGLKRCLDYAPSSLVIKSDSELMVEQLRGNYKVRNVQLKKLHQESMKLLNQIIFWEVEHIRREFNKQADQLANRGIDKLVN